MSINKEEEIKKYKDLIQEEIAYCYNCQPWEDGKYVWVLGKKSDLDDLFYSSEIPEELYEEVAEDLHCLNCGTTIQLGDEIGLYTPEEKALKEKITIWKKEYEKDLKNFSIFLQKYPYLGAEHPMGKKIISSIKQTKKSFIEEKEWYRARTICNGIKLKSIDFLPPDPTEVEITEGRYNHYGQSHWYLAESREGSAIECLHNKNDTYVWVQKIKISSLNNILDLSEYQDHGYDIDLPIVIVGIIYSGTLQGRVKHNSCWKPEYFIPRFIADTAKESEFKGIIFRNSENFHINLVIFNIDDLEYKFIDGPLIFEISHKSDFDL